MLTLLDQISKFEWFSTVTSLERVLNDLDREENLSDLKWGKDFKTLVGLKIMACQKERLTEWENEAIFLVSLMRKN